MAFGLVPTVKWSDFNSIKYIGCGGQGQVFRCNHSDWGDLAVKCLTATDKLTDEEKGDLLREASIMKEIRHKNCVLFNGLILEAASDPQYGIGIVMEYVENGNLSNFLKKYNSKISWDLKTMFAFDVALGMNYLHTLGQTAIHHFDLKANNVLVDGNLQLKIADFGLAEWTTIVTNKSTCEGKGIKTQDGTITHMAPERMRNVQCRKTEYIDVYSYGVTLWEIITGDVPFKSVNDRAVWNAVKDGQRPILDDKLKSEAPSLLIDLMNESWCEMDSERPRFKTIKARLDSKIQGKEFKDKVEGDKITLKGIIKDEGSKKPVTEETQQLAKAPESNTANTTNVGSNLCAAGETGGTNNTKIYCATSDLPQKARELGKIPESDNTANAPEDDNESDTFGDTETNETGTEGANAELVEGMENLYIEGAPQPNAPIQRNTTGNRSRLLMDNLTAGHPNENRSESEHASQRTTTEEDAMPLSLLPRFSVMEQTDHSGQNLSAADVAPLTHHSSQAETPQSLPTPQNLQSQSWNSATTLDFESGKSQEQMLDAPHRHGERRSGGAPPQKSQPPPKISKTQRQMPQPTPQRSQPTPQMSQSSSQSTLPPPYTSYPYSPDTSGYQLWRGSQHQPIYADSKTRGQAQEEQEQRQEPQGPQETQQVTTTVRTADGTIHIFKKGEKGSTEINLKGVDGVQIGDNNVMYVNKNMRQTSAGLTRQQQDQIRRRIISFRIDKFDKMVEQKHMDIASRHIGSKFRQLGRLLKFSDGEIDAVEVDYQNDGLMEKNYQMLRLWREKEGSKATIALLAENLTRIHKHDAAVRMTQA